MTIKSRMTQLGAALGFAAAVSGTQACASTAEQMEPMTAAAAASEDLGQAGSDNEMTFSSDSHRREYGNVEKARAQSYAETHEVKSFGVRHAVDDAPHKTSFADRVMNSRDADRQAAR